MSPHEKTPNWDRIVDEHAGRVARIAFKILGSEHDAEEVAQEVFTEAFLIHRRKVVQDWTGLLVRLASLRSLDRRRTSKETVSIEQIDAIGHDPSNSLEELELMDWLRAKITQLPARQAAVVTLSCFQEMSRDEVASALEMTPENVSATLYQARRWLKNSLALFEGGTK